MKKINKYIALGAMAVTVMLSTSCSDSWLEVEKPDGDPVEDYYKTKDHLTEALASAYAPTHWFDYGQGTYNALNIVGEIMGDNVWVGGQDIGDMDHWHLLFNYEASANKTLGSLWTCDYSGIKRCNDLMKYLEADIPDMTDDEKALMTAEGRALRVFYYNMLWHYFGNIPFYLENLTSPPYTAPQITADEVYDQLVAECEDVINSKVLPMRWDDNNAGRMSQPVAMMLYAEMVMYQNDEARFPTALGYMKEIINSGIYKLEPNFADIWETEGEWCDESIWEVNYEQTNSERDWGPATNVGGTVMPTLIAPNSYSGDDIWSQGQEGWGFMPIRKETYDMYAASDRRRDATVWVIPQTIAYTERYQDTHMWLQKYRPYDKNNKLGNSSHNLNYNNNLRMYRYSETLLNAAELSLRTGGSSTGEAKTWLNMVRVRAGIGDLAQVTIDNVLTERRLEFVGEGKRYFDLVRAEGISGASSANKATGVLVPDSYGYRKNSWTPKKKYIPIAQAELDSDPALVQNDY